MNAFRLFSPSDEGSAGPWTVRKTTEAYLEHLKQRKGTEDYSAHALEDATRELARFAEQFGNQTIEQCRRYDLTRWLQLNPQWKSNATKRRVMATILACFRWAEDEELIERTPYRRPRNLKLPVTPRREASSVEYIALMRCKSRPLRRALFFLRRTGARPSEMRGLRFDEIDFEAGVVVKQKHKTRAKTGKPRMFGLEPCILRFLQNLYRKKVEGQEFVFLNTYGEPWKDRHVFARHLRRWAKRIGLDEGVVDRVSGYCVRHSFCTWAIEAGVGDRQIADQMGHADTRMIAWYSKAAQKRAHLRDVATSAIKRKKRET
jgi:integrase